MMLILYAILLASAGLSSLSSLTTASSIKGHARPQESERSIKLAAPVVNNNIDKAAKAAPAPAVPILESTKKIYNDETIRRLAQPLVAAAAAAEPAPLVQQYPPAPVAVVKQQQPVVAEAAAPAPAPVVIPAAAPLAQPAVVEPVVQPKSVVVPIAAEPVPVPVNEQVVPVPVVVKESPPEVVVPVQQVNKVAAVVEPKSAPVESVPQKQQQQPAKPDELPPQSDRSAPIKAEPVVVAAAAPVVVPAVEQQPAVVFKPVVDQPAAVSAPVVQQQPPAVPVVQPEQPVVVSSVVSKESQLQAKKDEPSSAPAGSQLDTIEVPAPDPGLVLSEPIDSTTKLLIDLDEHVQKFLPLEDQQPAVPANKDQLLVAGVDYSPPAAAPVASNSAEQPSGKSSAPLVPYSSVAEDPIVPPLPSLDGVEKASAGGSSSSSAAVAAAAASGSSASAGSSSSPSSATRQGGQHQNQQQVITQLLDQLDSLQNRIQDTINQLVARRRYVMSALLRPMGTYVRRVRTNLERLQNRVNQLQAAAVSVGGGGGNRPGGFVDAAAIETIRRRIDDISKRISDIVNRIRFSLTPTSAPLNSNGRRK